MRVRGGKETHFGYDIGGDDLELDRTFEFGDMTLRST